MRVAHLWSASAVPLECGIRIGGQRGGVALDHGDPVAGPRQAERRAQATDAGADDDGVLRGCGL